MLLMVKYRELGNSWVQIAWSFPNRTDCMIKNRFNQLRRRERRYVGCVGMPNSFYNRVPAPTHAPCPPAPAMTGSPAPPDTATHAHDNHPFETPDIGYDMWGDDGSSEAFNIW
jgi:hypothetical protein